MKTSALAFLAGFIFALGLGISGMTQPQKIVGFLDFFGKWDPSLLFVMIGAITVHFLAYRLVKRLPSPLFSKEWFLPTDKDFPVSLLAGAAIFGIGWGMGGYCPGPALVSLASLNLHVFIFVLSMIAGMWAVRGARALKLFT